MNTVVIADFGGQYTHLIAKRVRSLGLFSVIVPPETLAKPLGTEVVGVILSGGNIELSRFANRR